MRLPWFLAFFSLLSSCFFTEASARGQEVGEPYLVRDIASNEIGSDPSLGGVFGDRVLLVASTPETGFEPWISDGTEAGTRLVSDLRPGIEGSFPRAILSLDERVLFMALNDDFVDELWASDGTLEGTRRLLDGGLGGIARVGSRAFFTRGQELWETDGTPEGTRALVELPAFADMDGGPVVDGRWVFGLRDGDPRGSLWISDGTSQGTQRLLARRLPTHTSSHGGTTLEAEIAAAHGTIYFEAERNPDQGFSDTDVWVSDGTRAGTRRLGEQVPQPPPFAPTFYPFGERMLLYLDALWISDGTSAGTYQLSEQPLEVLAVVGDLAYLRNPSAGGKELWVSDGSVAGTHPLAGFTEEIRLEGLQAVGNRLFFLADDGVHGREPWVSDGTLEGTLLLADVRPGPADSVAGAGAAVVAGNLYFIADGELWASDGTVANTRRVVVADGQPAAIHQLLAFHRGLFYLVASDFAHGAELWALPLAGPDDTLVLGPESRFEATVTWRDFRGAEGEGTAVALTEETGAFWFFEPSNLEVMVKVLDGRGINGHWWVYWGSLSNVGFTLTVRDTTTGAVWRYENPLGRFASGGDIEAF